MSTTISVIIPTYNRAEMLAQVLPAYLQFAEVQEVIVVDDGGADQTGEMLTAMQQGDARVVYLRHPANRGMTHARNTGIAHATGELILFSEDDLAPAPASLPVLAAHMQTAGADIIAGRRIWMRIGETEVQALARADRDRWPLVNRRLLEHYSHARTPNDMPSPLVNATMLVRRRVVQSVRFAGCFPGNAWREESDFQLRAQQAGFRVVFCPHVLFYHYDRTSAGRGRNRLKSDLVYLYWIYRNNLTFLNRHREYLAREIPESLILGQPLLTNLFYITYRTFLLIQTEARRALLSRRQAGRKLPASR
ncbi:glycosyltransferase [Caldilinea sp.]|uniref:glycosyltransferase family 2 protein n=1 Tax=Caldilinea sp. TaxID=2293560 RepID=UPI002D00D704|nr:glycosyltransferase family 2 protein [Anaerolineales bacterium]HQY93986.1 glycosyltransferase [Caldilinea sp.]